MAPSVLFALLFPATPGDRIVTAAEAYLGKPYVFGGRNGRRGCRGRCPEGIDCQSLIFFAFERVTGTPWTRFSVMPSISVARKELGRPVPGLDGRLREEIDRSRFRRGDVLFFLLEGYNLDADPPLLVRDGKAYGTWHMGLVDRAGGRIDVIHARPGDRVRIQPLDAIPFDALFAVRHGRP